MSPQAWAIWVVGLPGCGKSSLVRGIHAFLLERGVSFDVLEMDERRKVYIPNPVYSSDERELAYSMFVDEATELVAQGTNVLMDGAAHKLSMRQYARRKIERFAEIVVRCDLDEAIRRESSRPKGKVMAGLYRKALDRKLTGREYPGLGEVIGVDVEFEISPESELVIDNTHLSQEETLGKALHFLDRWLSDA